MVFSVNPGKNLDSTFNLAAISLIFAIYWSSCHPKVTNSLSYAKHSKEAVNAVIVTSSGSYLVGL